MRWNRQKKYSGKSYGKKTYGRRKKARRVSKNRGAGRGLRRGGIRL